MSNDSQGTGRSPLALIPFTLVVLLSCSVFPDPRLDTAALAPPAEIRAQSGSEMYGPTAVEWVQARFLEKQSALSPDQIEVVSRAIVDESLANDISWDLVLAVIHTESAFLNFARSHVGALGLMQIMPATGRVLAGELGMEWEGPGMLFRPELNVKMGTRYLGFLHARYGGWEKALAAYNWGPGAIDRRMRRGTAMPVQYVEKVYSALQFAPDTL